MLTQKDMAQDPYQGGGTGFYLKGPSGKTYIMTNRHVCNLSTGTTLWATASGSKASREVKIIEKSNNADLCILEASPSVTGLAIGSRLSLGQTIAYLGYPRLQPQTFTTGEAVGEQTITVFAGVINKKMTRAQCQTKDSFIRSVPKLFLLSREYADDDSLDYDIDWAAEDLQDLKKQKVQVCYTRGKSLVTTLMIYPGASGSPVFDFFGNIVAVVYASPSKGGWGYAVPLANINEIMKGR
jgi:S1-C subfamily serine protease